jgi:hypothetical protein
MNGPCMGWGLLPFIYLNIGYKVILGDLSPPFFIWHFSFTGGWAAERSATGGLLSSGSERGHVYRIPSWRGSDKIVIFFREDLHKKK